MADIIAFLGSNTTKVAVTVISTAVGIFLTIAKIKTMLPRPRLYLKEDIEILNSLDKDQEEYKIVSKYIQNRIRVIYSGQEEDRALFAHNKTLPKILGAMMVFSGIYLTYVVHESDSWGSWWYIGTIYLAVLGFGIMSIKDIAKRRIQIPHDRDQEDNAQK